MPFKLLPLTLPDAMYLIAPVLAALSLHDLPSAVAYGVLAIILASWWQDWHSCRAAGSYFAGRLTAFDLITSLNYVALVSALSLAPSTRLLVSVWVVVHWGLIFVIYIAWNLSIARVSDAATRRMFLVFSVVEVPLVGLCAAVVGLECVMGVSQRVLLIMLAIVASSHIGLLVAWKLRSATGTRG